MLFASDLDGTLLARGSVISRPSIAALAEVRELGLPVIAVTGRSPTSAVPILAPSGVIDVAVCNNGALEVDVASGAVVWAAYLPTDTLVTFLRDAPVAVPGLTLAWEVDGGYGWDDEFAGFTSDFEHFPARVASVLEPTTVNVIKLMIGHRELNPYELVDVLAANVDTDLEIATSGAPFLEATAPGINKGSALARMADIIGVDQADVVAYGDNQNDVSMLRWAGTGVSVANAHPSATAAADVAIGHHQDDAVARDIVARARGYIAALSGRR